MKIHRLDKCFLLETLQKIYPTKRIDSSWNITYSSYTDWEPYIRFLNFKLPMISALKYEQWDETKIDINGNLQIWKYKRIRNKLLFKEK